MNSRAARRSCSRVVPLLFFGVLVSWQRWNSLASVRLRVTAGIGVCTLDDISIPVLTTVIGHQRQRGLVIVDAGWMAMSRDRATAGQAVACRSAVPVRVSTG